MITESRYYQNSMTDKVWYDSSNIVYSEFVDDGNGKGQLYVTFKNGTTYWYKNVDLANDYILFKHGGTNPDMSNGKALNQFIKPKYEYERVSDKDTGILMEEFNKTRDFNNFLKDKKNVYFVYGETIPSGALRNPVKDIYSPRIQAVAEANPDARFILVNDTFGNQILSNMLDILNIAPKRIRVYSTAGSQWGSDARFSVNDSFNSVSDMLEQMTRDSGNDIIFISNADTLTSSAKCILRRHIFV